MSFYRKFGPITQLQYITIVEFFLKDRLPMAMAPKVQLVLKNSCLLGEGPHWDDRTNTLLLVDHKSRAVLRWNPVTDDLKTTIVEDPTVGCVVPRKTGGLVVAAEHRFAFLDEETGKMQTIQECHTEFPAVIFNDGKCDPAGRFWAPSPNPDPDNPPPNDGALYCLSTDHTMDLKVDQVCISNGLSWSPDKRTMYYCDSFKYTIDAYDYDVDTGNISNMQEVVKFDRMTDGIPDGHTVDVDGNLWVAMFSTGQIIKVDPRTGTKLEYLKISDTVLKTTSVCFGGPNLDELYVTSARNDPLKGRQDMSGCTFKVTELGTKGLPANVYEG
ncbi:regucalcin-like [Clavelina lepadiformis]|uniref:regucalcin-like n=1 Tax=Clavelina lepadiformis TaxID=159417 RepID=UPI004043935E